MTIAEFEALVNDFALTQRLQVVKGFTNQSIAHASKLYKQIIDEFEKASHVERT